MAGNSHKAEEVNDIRGMGNKTKYTKELGDKVCAVLETGKTLRAACRLLQAEDESFPTDTSVRRWASEHAEFASQYLRARELGYLAMADDIIEISEDGHNDTYLDEDGKPKTDWDVLGRSKLRVDTRKWLLSKCLPKIYGDKVTTELTGPNGTPLFDDKQREKRLAALATRIAQRNAQPKADNDVDDLV